jgi:hypothetical protein
MIRNRSRCRAGKLMSFSLLAGNTGSSRLIGESWKIELGNHLLNSAESRITQAFVPLISGSPFTNKGVWRGRRGGGRQQLI